MGNMATGVGDALSCFRKHSNSEAIRSSNKVMGIGRDIDDAVLAATNKSIQAD